LLRSARADATLPDAADADGCAPSPLRIDVCTPYFNPSPDLVDTLRDVLTAGHDVNLLTVDVSSHRFRSDQWAKGWVPHLYTEQLAQSKQMLHDARSR